MDNLDYYRIEKAINYLRQNFKQQPSLEDVANELGLSPFHFQRMFKKWAGITPKKFLQFLTVEHIKSVLRENQNVLDATFEAGLSSTSRSHDLFLNIEAVTPKEYRLMGKNLNIFYGFHNSPFGLCLIAVTDKGLCSLKFIEDKNEAINELKAEWQYARIVENEDETKLYFNKIFIDKKIANFDIFLKGTKFQIQVWKALLNVPQGSLTTYENIAKSINNPKALRAVGTAIGSNKIAYIIPCHRVINKLGVVGNYRWGTNRKKAIIAWELAKNKNL